MAWPQSREFFFSWKTDFLGNCSHEGQIHPSGSSSVFAQHLKEESKVAKTVAPKEYFSPCLKILKRNSQIFATLPVPARRSGQALMAIGPCNSR